jgi:tryptophan 2,3-dioxygenase
MGSRFGEEGRRLSYGTDLKVSELLSLQQGLTEAHDELPLIVAPLGKRFFPELWEVRSQL